MIDAVLSIRACYGGVTSGVRGAVGRYRAGLDGAPLDDLRRLAGQSEDQLAALLNNHQTTMGAGDEVRGAGYVVDVHRAAEDRGGVDETPPLKGP